MVANRDSLLMVRTDAVRTGSVRSCTVAEDATKGIFDLIRDGNVTKRGGEQIFSKTENASLPAEPFPEISCKQIDVPHKKRRFHHVFRCHFLWRCELPKNHILNQQDRTTSNLQILPLS